MKDECIWTSIMTLNSCKGMLWHTCKSVQIFRNYDLFFLWNLRIQSNRIIVRSFGQWKLLLIFLQNDYFLVFQCLNISWYKFGIVSHLQLNYGKPLDVKPMVGHLRLKVLIYVNHIGETEKLWLLLFSFFLDGRLNKIVLYNSKRVHAKEWYLPYFDNPVWTSKTMFIVTVAAARSTTNQSLNKGFYRNS